MARTKLNQRSADRAPVPMDATGGRTPPSKWAVAVLVVSILTAVWAAAMLTPFGRVAYYYFFAYAEFYMGVITLVSLSITIMVGLVSTDRLVLSIRQRVLLQSAHRTAGVIAVTALVAHVWTKLMEQHVRFIDIVIPFLAPYNTVYVGLGTLSGWVMMLVMWSGLARAKFIGRGRPWMWRSVHAVSYLMWPLALIHGLAAGRPAATWVVVAYVVCVLGVLVGLAVRLSVSLNRRKDFASTSQGSIKPVGSLVPTAAATAVKKRPRREEAEPVTAPETFRPAAPRPPAGPLPPATRPVSAMPASAMPASAMPASAMPASAMPASAMPSSSMPISPMPTSSMPISPMPYDDDRYAYSDTPRRRRRADEGYDEPTGRMSRRALEDYRDADESRGRRRARVEEEEAPRRRRYPDEDRYDRGYDDRYAEPPAARRREIEPPRRPEPDPRTTGEFRVGEYRDWEEDQPRRRRYADEDSGRHSRSEFVDLAPQADGWRGRADPNYMDPDETPTLVDMASRRARRQASQQAEPMQPVSRGARRGSGRGRGSEDQLDDAQYWRQLRGEAQ